MFVLGNGSATKIESQQENEVCRKRRNFADFLSREIQARIQDPSSGYNSNQEHRICEKEEYVQVLIEKVAHQIAEISISVAASWLRHRILNEFALSRILTRQLSSGSGVASSIKIKIKDFVSRIRNETFCKAATGFSSIMDPTSGTIGRLESNDCVIFQMYKGF